MSIRIGIMSFAHLHAEAYIQNLRAIPGVEMIGLADDDPSAGNTSPACSGRTASARMRNCWKPSPMA